MHVCFVTGVFPPQLRGGAENYVVRVAAELRARGHRTTVITTEPYRDPRSCVPCRESLEGMDIWRFYPANIAHRARFPELGTASQVAWRTIDTCNPHAATMVAWILSHERPDIVHTNNLIGISALSSRAIKRTAAKHVHSLHDYNLLCPSGSPRSKKTTDSPASSIENHPLVCNLFSKVQRAAFGTPDAVTGPSQHVLDTHREFGFFEHVDARRIRLGVAKIRNEAPSPPPSPAVLYVGRITELKGIGTLLDAATELPDIDVHICGTGSYQDELERRVVQHSNVTYHGYVSDEKLRDLRQRSTIGVVPSLWMENSPLTIYESFAAGLPVVGSDIGGIPELIIPGETGELFRPNDPNDLATAIRACIDPGHAATMGRRALAWAKRHTVKDHVDTLIETTYERGIHP